MMPCCDREYYRTGDDLMQNDLLLSKNSVKMDESEWKYAIERAAGYILRHPMKDISFFVLLRSIDDERLMNMDAEETKRFFSELARNVSYRISCYSDDKKACIINYDPAGPIKNCKIALKKLIEENGSGDLDAIKELLKKQNFTQDVIEIAMQLRILEIMQKRKKQTRETA